MPGLSDQITETVRSFLAEGPPEDFLAVFREACDSNEFIANVLLAQHAPPLLSGDLLAAYILAQMIWVGMRIERARNEVNALERLYRGGGA
jgi:hypothetical protein